MIDNIHLSAHLDDAALSCSGLILLQIARKERVRVINFFAGVPDFAEDQFSPYAQKQHAKWKLLPKEAVAMRRLEDQNAANLLGVETENWDYYDAIYRKSKDEFFYTDHQKLFGPIHPDEDRLIDELTDKLELYHRSYPQVVFYAPLWVGGHVDHLVVRECAIKLVHNGANVVFYEDFPYAGRAEWKDEPTTVDKAIRKLPFSVTSTTVPIDAEAKIKVNMAYRSQMFSLFGDWEGIGLAREVREYTRKVGREAGFEDGFFERYWSPQL